MGARRAFESPLFAVDILGRLDTGKKHLHPAQKGKLVWQSAATLTDQNLAAAWRTLLPDTGGSATRLSVTGACGSAVAGDRLTVIHDVKSVCPIPDSWRIVSPGLASGDCRLSSRDDLA